MKILITGSQGMIGSHLKNYLKEWFEIVEFEGDVTHKDAWDNYPYPESYYALIHLAAFAGVRDSMKNPDKYYNNNVISTRHALEWGRHAKYVLYASSSNAYEWWGNPYATTKKINEEQGKMYKNTIGMRFHTVWPGRDDMLYQKLKRKEVSYINELHTRDFIHVEDLCSAIRKILDNFDHVLSEVGNVVDIGTGHGTSVKSVAKGMGFEGQYISDDTPGERIHTRANVEWLYNLGWGPQHNILNYS